MNDQINQLSVEDIKNASDAFGGSIKHTPATYAITLSKITGADVYIKNENAQFTSSFKVRGALNKLMNLTDEQKKCGVIAASAGNHAQGLAFHGRRLGIPTTIAMPLGTPFIKVSNTEELGAKVVQVGERFDETAEEVMKMADEKNLTVVHPFDDYHVMAGQGTIGLELLEDISDIDVVLVPVGGGGLIAGIATAIKSMNSKIKVIGVQSERFPSLYRAMNDEEYVPQGSTLAEGIAVKNIGEKTLEVCKKYVDDVLLVSEEEIEKALGLLLTIEKTVCEGAGACPLAAVIRYPEVFKGKKVALIVSGGNIDTRLLASILMRSLVRDGRITRLKIELPDIPGALSIISSIIGNKGGNIIDVSHHRLFTELPAKETYSNITLETRDSQHFEDILEEIRSEGFVVTVNPNIDM
jgi:threonine dehydratase